MSRLPLTTAAEFNAAVAAAKAAFPAWRSTPVPTRARVMLKFQELIRQNWVRACVRDRAAAPAPDETAAQATCVGSTRVWRALHNRLDAACLARLHCLLLCQDELAKSVTLEQGKTFQDAKGDVFRGLGAPAGGGAARGTHLQQPLAAPAQPRAAAACSSRRQRPPAVACLLSWASGA